MASSVLAGLIYACGGSGSGARVDAGSRDGGDDAGDEAAMEASLTDAPTEEDVATDDSGLQDAMPVSAHDSGSSLCSSRADCPSGVCCADLAAGRPSATCVPAGMCMGVALCGETAKGSCVMGTCEEYECTAGVPARMTVIYACSSPSGPGATCFRAPSEGGLPPAGDSGS